MRKRPVRLWPVARCRPCRALVLVVMMLLALHMIILPKATRHYNDRNCLINQTQIAEMRYLVHSIATALDKMNETWSVS